MIRDAADRQDKIDGLSALYCAGTISEPVYEASLKNLLPPHEARYLVGLHQASHRNSPNFKRGIIR